METVDVRKEANDYISDLQDKPVVVKLQIRGIIEKNREEESLKKTIEKESGFDGGYIHSVIGDDMAIGENFKDWIIEDKNYKYVALVKKDGKWRKHHTTFHSVDSAMLGILEFKYDGLNSQFAMFASRMIGID